MVGTEEREEEMRVIVKNPGKPPEERDVKNELHALQELVGGYIETVRVNKAVIAVVNEEGIIRGLPYNCTLIGWFQSPHIFGPIIFMGDAGEDFCDLPETFTLDDAEEVII